MSDALLTGQDQQEALSRAYVAAIAAMAGYVTYVPDLDRDSVDIGFKAGGAMRPNLHAQLKATINLRKSGSDFAFSLNKKNYDDLRAATQVPRILVVLRMPRKQAAWLDVSVSRLIMRRCAYWVSLSGLPDLAVGQLSKTITIPGSNLFDCESLKTLMDKSRQGIPL
jgi:Domain of unknown function (DUF4365)